MKKLLRIFLLLLLLVSLFFVFQIRKVSCFSLESNLEEGVCNQIESKFLGKSLFFTDFQGSDLWQQLADDSSYSHSYQLVDLEKQLPGEIHFGLSSQMADYRLVLVDGERYLLGENRKLKDNQEKLNLLEIHYQANEEIIEKSYLKEAKATSFLSLAKAIQEFKIPASKVIWKSPEEIELRLPGLLVYVDQFQDFSLQMQRLSYVLNDQLLAEELSQAKSLDLRFQLPSLKK